MINGIHHVAISTVDIDRLSAFYRQVGFSDVVDMKWEKGDETVDQLTALHDSAGEVQMLRLGNCHLELFQFSSPQASPLDENRPVCDHGITHLCLDVTDLDSEYSRLVALGMKFHCEPKDIAPGVRTTYGRDPDGNVLELQEVCDKTHTIAL
jgi:catechol 2,3-dioxygenase-like lactoylglutathione lyase family enzyme